MDDSISMFFNKINETKSFLIKDLSSLPGIFTLENKEAKVNILNVILNHIQNIKKIILEKDMPDWVNALEEHILKYKQKMDRKNSHYPFIIQCERFNRHISHYSFKKDYENLEGLDIDYLFEKYKSQSKLNDLFNEVNDLLNKLICSGEINDGLMLSELKRTISTIEKNRNSSYSSIKFIWSLLKNLFFNLIYHSLRNISGLTVLVDAFADTMKKMEEELNNIEVEVKSDISKYYKSDIPFITYDKKGEIKEFIERNVDSKA